jgi:hypothetical protein
MLSGSSPVVSQVTPLTDPWMDAVRTRCDNAPQDAQAQSPAPPEHQHYVVTTVLRPELVALTRVQARLESGRGTPPIMGIQST